MAREPGAAVYVAGHNGMVGSAIVRRLMSLGYVNIVTALHSELDLVDQRAVQAFFDRNRIDQVYLAAAKVGGIIANNSSPADFIYDNLLIEANIIKSSHDFGVPKLLFLGSSCIYPRLADQPIREEALMAGELEPTNEPYAVAKIAGIKLCESFNRQYGRDYRSVMPSNLYGPGDNYHASFSHVIPGLLRRFHDAREHGEAEVVIWGSGSPRREFLHVDDMAAASVHIMELDREAYQTSTTPMLSHVNVGTGSDCSIKDLAMAIAKVTGFTGKLTFDTSKPDGTPRKLLDVSRIRALGWESTIDLEDGLDDAYTWFVSHQADFRGR
ncbi:MULTISPECIES: GDP-L-fucose synthase [Cryobacterium]|uniref:GDP-L-fucose synthase n=1 Tax=Cryobacterium breve TaxID=1259258 RepID=A0ABY2J1E6_9MICO|nr:MULTISPECIES: GDP-L-fucose synthase [Cryobacterium]TFC94240.1 GDP-L-fucose synthase [Cryobacterium sp. TmT3-12]TFC98549.1 GDP-L-fucose synthase [Cryobacterium breve]